MSFWTLGNNWAAPVGSCSAAMLTESYASNRGGVWRLVLGLRVLKLTRILTSNFGLDCCPTKTLRAHLALGSFYIPIIIVAVQRVRRPERGRDTRVYRAVIVSTPVSVVEAYRYQWELVPLILMRKIITARAEYRETVIH